MIVIENSGFIITKLCQWGLENKDYATCFICNGAYWCQWGLLLPSYELFQKYRDLKHI